MVISSGDLRLLKLSCLADDGISPLMSCIILFIIACQSAFLMSLIHPPICAPISETGAMACPCLVVRTSCARMFFISCNALLVDSAVFIAGVIMSCMGA